MKCARGYTLFELVIVVIVVGILSIALMPMAMNSLQAYNATRDDLIVLDKLRYATERLARELRAVNFDGTKFIFAGNSMSTSAPSFTRTYSACSDSTCTLINDTTAVITVGRSGTLVTLADSTLPSIDAMTLTDDVSSLAFTYFDKNGTATSSTVNVRYVQIALTLTHNGNDYVQRTRVELRNR